jgi:hypothetical protein
MSTKKSEHWIEQTITMARAFSEGQPSEADRADALAALDAMIEALQNIRTRLSSLPSEEERRRVGDAADALERFLDSMKARPGIAASLGLAMAKTSPAPRKREDVDVDVLLADLEELATDEIQKKLLNEQEFTLPMLHSIARKLGLSGERTANRHDLVDRIVKLGFANKRGYQLLGRARHGAR